MHSAPGLSRKGSRRGGDSAGCCVNVPRRFVPGQSIASTAIGVKLLAGALEEHAQFLMTSVGAGMSGMSESGGLQEQGMPISSFTM